MKLSFAELRYFFLNVHRYDRAFVVFVVVQIGLIVLIALAGILALACPRDAHCQRLALAPHSDTLTLDAPRFGMWSVVSAALTNDGADTLTVDVAIDDTTDFAVWGIVSPLPPHQHRVLVIGARRNVWHDTTVTVTLTTNDPNLPRGVATWTVQGIASTSMVRGETTNNANRGRAFFDVLGRPCDSTQAGVVFSATGKRVNVR